MAGIAFDNPYFLQLGWLIPILIIAWVMIRRRQAARLRGLGDLNVFKNLTTGYLPAVSYLKFALLIVGLGLLILSLAKPVVKSEVTSAVPVNQTALVFALDVSKSMLVADVAPNRLTRAKSMMNKVISGLNGEQVGIVVFAGNASAYIPLTTDYKMATEALEFISVNAVSRPGTSLAEAVKTSALLLNTKDIKVKSICLLSDGENLMDSFAAPADSARKTGIHLYTIGVGTQTGDHITQPKPDGSEDIEKDKTGAPIVSRLRQDNLVKISGGGDGHYQTLTNPVDNANQFLAQLHQVQSNVKQKTPVHKDIFQLFLLIALGLLMAETLLPQSFRRDKF